LKEKGVVTLAGGWFKMQGTDEKFQGNENLKVYVRENYKKCAALLGDYLKNVDIMGEEQKKPVKKK
jgi:hypothetical protein